MKKALILTIATLFLALTVVPVLAQTDYGPYGTQNLNVPLGTKDLRGGIMGIINVFLGFLGVLALVIILYGGFVWLTSAGNEEKVGQAKKIIISGIVGLIIIFISYAIVVFVINSLVGATGANTGI